MATVVDFRLAHTVGQVVFFQLLVVLFDAFNILAGILASTQIALLQVDSHMLSFLRAQRRFNTLGMKYISAIAILPGVALMKTCAPLEQAMRAIIAGAIVIIQHFPARSG